MISFAIDWNVCGKTSRVSLCHQDGSIRHMLCIMHAYVCTQQHRHGILP